MPRPGAGASSRPGAGPARTGVERSTGTVRPTEEYCPWPVRSKLRAAAVALALVSVTIPLVVSAPASAQDGTDVIDGCRVAVGDGGSRACSAAERLVWLAAQHCRRVPDADEAVCPSLDGRDTSEAAVADFEQGWTARALELQSRTRSRRAAHRVADPAHPQLGQLGRLRPVIDVERRQPGPQRDRPAAPGHPRHRDRRPLDPAPHRRPGPGLPGPRAVPRPVAVDAGRTIHVGCSVDQPLVDLFGELRTWLDRPEAADQLVLLYLENQLEGSPAAHDATMAALESTLGDLVFRPEQGAGCQTLPFARPKGEILATGARVLVTGNCGPAAAPGTTSSSSGAPHGTRAAAPPTYLAGSDCDTERGQQSYDTSFVRRYEDSTGLSLAATGGSYISPAVAAAMVRCGVNMPGLDQLHPADGRLPAFVWSWREGDRADDPTRACAAQGDDTRFGSLPCERALPGCVPHHRRRLGRHHRRGAVGPRRRRLHRRRASIGRGPRQRVGRPAPAACRGRRHGRRLARLRT